MAGAPVAAPPEADQHAPLLWCTLGLSQKNALKVAGSQDAPPAWALALFGIVLALVDSIFNQKWLLAILLDQFATEENVRAALQGGVYVNPARVTDDLVADYLSLAADKARAVEVLRQIYTNDGGPVPFTAAEALPEGLPILTVWGDRDSIAPVTGPVGKYFRRRANALPASCRFEEIPAGHVPQDDNPEATTRILREWLANL